MDLNKIMTDMKNKLNVHTIKNDFNGMCLPKQNLLGYKCIIYNI